MFNYNKVSDNESTSGLNICPLDGGCRNYHVSHRSHVAADCGSEVASHRKKEQEQEINRQLFP